MGEEARTFSISWAMRKSSSSMARSNCCDSMQLLSLSPQPQSIPVSCVCQRRLPGERALAPQQRRGARAAAIPTYVSAHCSIHPINCPIAPCHSPTLWGSGGCERSGAGSCDAARGGWPGRCGYGASGTRRAGRAGSGHVAPPLGLGLRREDTGRGGYDTFSQAAGCAIGPEGTWVLSPRAGRW